MADNESTGTDPAVEMWREAQGYTDERLWLP